VTVLRDTITSVIKPTPANDTKPPADTKPKEVKGS